MARTRGQCFARGPHGEQCTDTAGHDYAHYSASDDRSWTDRLEDHPDECRCDLHRPDLYSEG